MKFSWSYFAIKMTSRKLWMSIAGLAVAIMTLMSIDSNTQVKITSLISAISVVVAYLIANGLTDDTSTEDVSGTSSGSTASDATAAVETVEEVADETAATVTDTAASTSASTEQVTAGLDGSAAEGE